MKRKLLLDESTARGFENWTHRCLKAILYHTNGKETEVKISWPIMTVWSEDQEVANMYISKMVEHWANHFANIFAYQVLLGSISNSGEERYSISYPITNILSKEDHVRELPMANHLQNRAGFQYLKPVIYGNDALVFSYQEVVILAFDATLPDEEVMEFREIMMKAKKEAAEKGKTDDSIEFFVRPESGVLTYRLN